MVISGRSDAKLQEDLTAFLSENFCARSAVWGMCFSPARIEGTYEAYVRLESGADIAALLEQSRRVPPPRFGKAFIYFRANRGYIAPARECQNSRSRSPPPRGRDPPRIRQRNFSPFRRDADFSLNHREPAVGFGRSRRSRSRSSERRGSRSPSRLWASTRFGVGLPCLVSGD